jgi:hypothetical protein
LDRSLYTNLFGYTPISFKTAGFQRLFVSRAMARHLTIKLVVSQELSTKMTTMKTSILVALAAVMFMTGCHRWFDEPHNNFPPSAPRGLRTSTGDNFIELFWDQNPEPDIEFYYIFVSSSYNGRYEQIGTSREPYFNDNGARNGVLYYYAVSAVNFDGLESPLSKDVAYDIPRPEGYNVVLTNYRQAPSTAGYVFSEYAVVPYDDSNVDMFFEYYSGVMYMDVPTDCDIQDVGPTGSILDISTAPTTGWSPTHDVQLTAGHTYVVWTWDDHYAKFRVSALSTNRVVFDWAYQLQQSNPMLKRAPGPRGAISVPMRAN